MYTLEELNEKALRLKELKRKAEDLATTIENLEKELKAEMTERGTDELIGDDWKITWSRITSNRFNQSEFKAAHPNIYEEFMRVSESRRFTIK